VCLLIVSLLLPVLGSCVLNRAIEESEIYDTV